jgi:hypothetical protein
MDNFDWVMLLPPQERERLGRRRSWQRRFALVRQRKTWALVLVVLDLGAVTLIGLRTGTVLGGMALLPLLLTPLLAGLVYWLVWMEFHR